MAQIPGLEQFGNARPQGVQIPNTSAAFASAGKGELAIGQAAGSVAADLRAEEQASQRAASALALANITNGLQDAHKEIAAGVIDGSIPADKAESTLRQRARDVMSSGAANLPPHERAMIEAHSVGTMGTLDRNLGDVVLARKRSETASTIDQFGEAVSRQVPQLGPGWASEKFAAMVDFTGGAAGWTPEVAAKKKQAFKETAHYGFFDAAGTDALTRSDAAGVGAVIERVKGPEGEALDPIKRTQLTHQLFGYQQHILAQQRAAANRVDEEQRRRENAAADITNKAIDITVNGGQFSPEFIKLATATAAGTTQQMPLGTLLAGQSPLTGFATKSPAERAAMLDTYRAGRSTPGVGVDPEQDKMIAQLTSIDARVREQYKENPWQAAATTGRIAAAPLITASNAGDFMEIMRSRMGDIRLVEQGAGRKVSPLQPQEADQVVKMLRTMQPDQAATMLGNFGQILGDSERVADLGKQIHDKDGILGLAMSYATTQTTEGRHVAELVLRGEQAIKDKAIKPDGAIATGWMGEITKQVRGAYANQEVEDKVVRAAYLITAARGREGNEDVDNAVRLATGGGIIDFNGSRVVMPVGFAAEGGQSGAEDRFRKAISTVDPAQFFGQMPDGKAYAGRAPMAGSEFVAGLKDAKLITAGQGAYWVKAGNTLVSNVNGVPIVVRLK